MARILVIDDDQRIRHLLRAVLERRGYSVVEAENGDEGLQRYQAKPTDVVITDMEMPVIDGLQMIRELQRTFPTAKVIAISGGKRAINLARTLVQHTLEKPLCLEALLDVVQQLVSAPAPSGRRPGSVEPPHNLEMGA